VLRQGRVAGRIAPAERRALPEEEVAARILRMMFGPQPDAAAPPRRAPPDGLAPVLEVEDLSTRPDGAQPGLDRVALALRPGEVLGVAGLEGQGQRALAEALAGQAVPEAGRIRLCGRDVTALGVAAREALGLRHVTDDRLGEGIVAPFSLALNLLLKRVGAPPFWRGGMQDEAAIRRHAEAAIARHDIRAPGPATPAGRLSGGNVQKAILARELDEGARVVVLNRPTHGLDHAATQATHRRIREAAEAGVALLLISAEIEELLLLCDRVLVLSRGRVAGEVANAPGAGARIGALIAA
jgi:simple sugar transport system ATP-binding protein